MKKYFIPALLTGKHGLTRLHIAREHLKRTIDNWKRFLFFDETSVSLNSLNGCQKVCKRPVERFIDFRGFHCVVDR